MAETKLVGQNYTTPDLVAKVTGKAKYAEDFRADGMLFAKLLLSPMPHARVRSIDTSAAEAMPGVKAILTVDDFPGGHAVRLRRTTSAAEHGQQSREAPHEVGQSRQVLRRRRGRCWDEFGRVRLAARKCGRILSHDGTSN